MILTYQIQYKKRPSNTFSSIDKKTKLVIIYSIKAFDPYDKYNTSTKEQ